MRLTGRRPPTGDGRLPLWVWFIVGAVAFLMLAFMASTYFSTPPAPPPTPVIPTATPRPTPTVAPTWTPLPTVALEDRQMRITTAALGEKIEAGYLILTAKAIAPRSSDAQPAPGSRWVLLDLTIENTGGAVVAINSAREFILKDDTNQIYKISPAAVAVAGGTTPDVDLGPYETIRAQVGFEAPTGAQGLMLNFAADKFKAGRILIAVP